MGRSAIIALLLIPSAALAVDEASKVAAIESKATDINVQLGMVKDLVERGETPPLEKAQQLFHDGETDFLIENYDQAAAKLMDAIGSPEYHSDKTYSLAVYYLAESLYQIESYADAKKYFKLAVQVMEPKTRRYQDCLVRLIRLSDLTGDLQGVDQYYAEASKVGGLRPELSYLYGKWLSMRSDLPPRERDLKAATAFADVQPGQPFYPQALYFRSALLIDLGYQDNALLLFKALTVLKDVKNEPKLPLLRDLAQLALGRIYLSKKDYKNAILAYHALQTNSPYFVTSLYERAIAYLQSGDFPNALRTCETLVLLGKDSANAPSAALFQANLLLRMGNADPSAFEKASLAFQNIVQTYQPVRDQIRAIVDRPDPVGFFDDLFKRDPTADFTAKLPLVAQGYMDSNASVALGHAIQSQLAGGKKTLDESNVLAKKMLEALTSAGMHAFPQLSEADSRAVELANRLTLLQGEVFREQVELLGDDLTPASREKLAKLQAERGDLDKLFLDLPRSSADYEKRLAKFRKSVSDLEYSLFQVRRKLETVNAVLAGLDHWWHQTLDEQNASPATRAEREKDFQQWRQLVDQLDARRVELSEELSKERIAITSRAAGGGEEDDLRARYQQEFTDMKSLVLEALPLVKPENRALLSRLDALHTQIDTQQTTLASMRDNVRTKVNARIDSYRQRIVAEQANVDDETLKYGDVSGESNKLIGSMAVEAFRKVEHDFSGIVQRGDVGLIDVAWTKKQLRTKTIEKYAKDKDEGLKVLRDRFQEVLSDAE